MKLTVRSLNGGEEEIDPIVVNRLSKGLESMSIRFREKSASVIRSRIGDLLRQLGWSDRIRISAQQAITLTAKKGRVALCVQTGNMARFYADLLKLQAQFYEGKIEAAVYLVPTKDGARKLGSNLANSERMIKEINSVFKKVITVPLIVIGLDE